ncbi:MAG: hypothetical protein LBF88_01605 [Planctomycetaceae bacterium]|nr:hypothetical protein [Planctomycetaceae bacterium]
MFRFLVLHWRHDDGHKLRLEFYLLMLYVVGVHCTNQRIISFRIEIFHNLFIIKTLTSILDPGEQRRFEE